MSATRGPHERVFGNLFRDGSLTSSSHAETVQDAAAAAIEEVADQARDIISDLADATLDETPADTPYDDVVMVTTGSRHPSRHGYGGDSDGDDEGGGGGGGDGSDDGNGENDQEDDELDGYIDWGLVDDAAGGDRVAGGTPAIPTRARSCSRCAPLLASDSHPASHTNTSRLYSKL